MRPAQLLAPLVVFTAVSTAWPWEGSWQGSSSWQDVKAIQDIGALLRRADTTTTDTSTTAPATKTTSAAAKTSSTDSSAASSTDASSAAASSSGSASSAAASSGDSSAAASSSTTGGSSKTTKKTTTNTSSSNSSTSYDFYGGATMVIPAATASSSYYKVGNYVTFAWNYTSVSVTPTAVDILVSCSANAETYTLAMNQSFDATGNTVTWDTGEYQSTATIPLLTETYTLIIHDAARDATATAAEGHLAAYSAHTFGIYVPQAYTGLSDGWICVTCSGAMTNMERQTLGVMLGVAGLTVASFTWFAGGWGVF